uniref:Immunoglobulin domain-containing protein n=1 Tax=Cyprinus carpio carpio TaxID=630221 RepID=A0A9J8CI33_CYPCA
MFKENTLVLFCLCFCHLVGVFADTDTVKSVSVKEGDSVTLQINVTEIQTDDMIEWKFGTNNFLIAKINGKTSKIFDGPDGRFRDRLKLDHQTGSLIITNTTITDSGLYELKISSTSSSGTKHRFNVTVNGSSDSPDRFPILLISAAAAGSLLLLVAVGIICIYRKQRTTDQHVETCEEVITYADPTFYKRKAQSAKQEDDVVYAGVVHRR